MNKLQMAHDYAKIMLAGMVENGSIYQEDTKKLILSLIQSSFNLAEAMQAEADNREDKTSIASLDEWQPDWGQAPDWAEYAIYSGYIDYGFWCEKEPSRGHEGWQTYGKTQSFNDCVFAGDWRESLRKRPE